MLMFVLIILMPSFIAILFTLTLCAAVTLSLILMSTAMISFITVSILTTLKLFLLRPYHLLSLSLLLFTILLFVFFNHTLFSIFQPNYLPLHLYVSHQKQLLDFYSILLFFLLIHFFILGLVVLLLLFSKFPPPSIFKISFSRFSLALHIPLSFLSPPLPSLSFFF